MCTICGFNPCSGRCPNAPEPQIRGCCQECGEDLREDYEYYIDDNDNKFCSEDCALKYYGVRSKEWEAEEEDWYE